MKIIHNTVTVQQSVRWFCLLSLATANSYKRNFCFLSKFVLLYTVLYYLCIRSSSTPFFIHLSTFIPYMEIHLL